MSVSTDPVLGRPETRATPPRLFSPEYRSLVLGVVAVVVAVAFEAIAVATAMPVAARELDGLQQYGLAFSIFLTTSLLGMVAAGEISDRRGPVLPFVAASAVFATGLAIAGTAPSMWVLVLARGVQGFGAGLNIVALYVVVARAFPESLRPRVFSAMSSGWILPALVGPPIAGLLADRASWRWVFLGVLPLVVVATALVLPHLRGLEQPRQAAGHAERRGRSRMLPALAAAVGTGLLQYAGQLLAWASLPLLIVALALLVPSVPRLLPAGALRLARGLPTVVVLRGVFAGAFFGAETFIPLMLVEQRGLATTLAGASLTGGALTWALGSWYQGRPGLRVARPHLVTAGLILVAVGIAVTATVLADAVPAPVAALGWLVAGLGMGLGITSLSVLVLELSSPEEQGASSAALQVSDAFGSIVLIGLGGAIFAGLHTPGQDNAGVFLLIFLVMAAVAVVGALVSPRSHG
ncbi:MAG: MFS transporter [Actinomycetes bacterium]